MNQFHLDHLRETTKLGFRQTVKSVFFILGCCLLVSCQQKSKTSESPLQSHPSVVASKDEPQFIANEKQLTFSGPRAGEGYFSQDGQLMVFQAEREPGNPFYQIYLRNMKTGKTDLISNGEGKTTCAWIHPSSDRVMYSSTHLDPNWRTKAEELKQSKKKGEKEKYSWSYDDQFDIFEKNLKTGKLKPISPALGYDAEGSYSPDGKWIAFASNRHVYTKDIKPEDQKRREDDPSYFLDIYIMKSDGTDLKRLTEDLGYDGGPFFSPDGQRITWRKFTADGRKAEIWTMKVDGSDKKQITDLGAMSWAPFYHPSGDYLIFTTNLLGYDNFELYAVDVQGLQKPVRVSYRSGFDGLPVFLPNGSQLAWTQKGEKGESQIWIGDWNDALIRKRLNLPAKAPLPVTKSSQIQAEDLKSWVDYLASAEFKGRSPGTIEEKKYSQTIAHFFKALGLQPAHNSSYFQEFNFTSGVQYSTKLKNSFSYQIKDKWFDLAIEKSWVPLNFSANQQDVSGPVVFAGFGLRVPSTEKIPEYDSLKGLDVNGKWLFVLGDVPEHLSNEERFHFNLYSRLQHKALVAREAGAKGLVVIVSDQLPLNLKFETGSSGVSGLPVLALSESNVRELFKASQMDFDALKAQVNHKFVAPKEINGLSLNVSIGLEKIQTSAINTLARLKVPGSKGTLVVGAHGDHLGLGEGGNSLARKDERGQIHFGADDNASGVAMVMEIAEYLTMLKRENKLKSDYDIVFAIWSAEEMGVLGSQFFNENQKDKFKAYINMDMVGRLKSQLSIQGLGSSAAWGQLLEPLIVQSGLAVSTVQDPYLPTDAMAFYMKGTPILSFFTGSHEDYHSPRDTSEKLNYQGMVKIGELVSSTILEVASQKNEIPYQKVQSRPAMGGKGFRIYLGTIPDYSQDGIKGVKISGTMKGSPSESAGLKEGDVIVELGGIKIENMQDYVYCLQSIKADQKTKMKVTRSGKLVELEVTPALKGI